MLNFHIVPQLLIKMRITTQTCCLNSLKTLCSPRWVELYKLGSFLFGSLATTVEICPKLE